MKPALVVAMICFSFCSLGYTYSGGTGDPNNPYQIATREDLLALGATTADYGKSFILTADIDLDPNLPGGQVFTTAIIAPVHISGGIHADWFEEIPFTGIFDGNNHKIMNLIITDANEYLGLFGYLGHGGMIKNLEVEDCFISGSSTYYSHACGSLAAVIEQGAITNCHSTGVISNIFDLAGGLAGVNFNSNISNSYSAVAVSGSTWIGGLVGQSYDGIISNCYAAGEVTGSQYSEYVGSLVAESWGDDISGCYSTGAVSGTSYVGGLVGRHGSGNIGNCYSSSPVSCGDFGGLVGGLVGENDATILNSYATGSVSGNYAVGGLVGRNWGFINNCYAAGAVSNGFDSFRIGGLVGDSGKWDGSYGIVNSCFWDIQISGQTTSNGGTGKTTAEMKTLSTFTSAGWDFDTPVWTINEVIDYPRLAWENTAAPLEGKLKITPQTINKKSSQPHIQCDIELPEGIVINDIDMNEPVTVYPGEVKAQKQSVSARSELSAFFDKDALMAVIPANGSVELKAAGKLNSGQYFYGSDTVRINH